MLVSIMKVFLYGKMKSTEHYKELIRLYFCLSQASRLSIMKSINKLIVNLYDDYKYILEDI